MHISTKRSCILTYFKKNVNSFVFFDEQHKKTPASAPAGVF
jgi:hypothetical protein